MAQFRLSALALLCFLASSTPYAFCQHSYDPRPPLVYGICRKPFPAVLNLDYPFCRASAWLSALERANNVLPPLPASLAQSGLPPNLERLAVCALACPPEVVTPENAPGEVVRVFLRWPLDPEHAVATALREGISIWLEMAIILETRRAVERIAHLWPRNAKEVHEDLPELETEASLLRQLWDRLPGGDPGSIASVAALFAAIRSDRKPEVGTIEPALAILLKREVSDPANAALWRRLAACLLFNRGLALEGRPGLAATDFGAALARLQDAPTEKELRLSILSARGRLYQEQRNFEAMCADYLEACSLGQCQLLSLARRGGHCLEAGSQ